MGYGSGLPNLFPRLTYQCNPQLADVVARSTKDQLVLDMGAGGRRVAKHVKTVDFVDTGDTDYICDVCDVPLENEAVDMIVATGLLEHVEDADKFVMEAHRLLKQGGVLHIELPFLQQYHDDPIDCRRYTVPGLKRYLEQQGFEATDSGFHIGPSVTIATLNAYYAALLFEGKNPVSKVLSNGAFMLMSILGYPLKFLDKWLQSRPSAHRLAFGIYCTAKKA